MSSLRDIHRKFGSATAFDEVERRLTIFEVPSKHTLAPGFSHDRAMHILRRLLIRLVPNGAERVRQIGIEEAFKEATATLDTRDNRIRSQCCIEDYEDCTCESPSFEVSAYREGLEDGAHKRGEVLKQLYKFLYHGDKIAAWITIAEFLHPNTKDYPKPQEADHG